MRIRIIALLLVALAGCQTTPPLPPVEHLLSPAYAARQQRLNTVNHWSLRGQVAIINDGHSLSGQLVWQQNRDALDVALRDPFGRPRLKVVSNGHDALLTIDGEQYQSDAPEQLLNDVADLNLPLSVLPGWLRGAAGDECLLTALATDNGEPATLICDIDGSRWQVDYLSWQQVAGEALPRKLEINGPQMNLKLVIGRWQHPDQTL